MVKVAKLGRPHGVRGHLNLLPLAGAGDYFAALDGIFVAREGGEPRRYEVVSITRAGKGWRVALAGVEDRTAAAALVNAVVYLERAQLPVIEADEAYLHDLYDHPVFDIAGNRLGLLVGFIETGAADVLVIDADGTELLVPTSFITDIVAGEHLVVDPPEGLLEIYGL